MTERALVIGEALIDIVERDGQVIGEHVGGSPLNVAVGLARLGRGVDFLTHIGDDPRGRRIADYVTKSGAQLVSGSVDSSITPLPRWRRWTRAARRSTCSTSTGSCRARRRWLPRWWRTPVPSPRCSSPAAERPLRCWTPTTSSATITFDPNVRPALITEDEQARDPHRPSCRAVRRGQGQRRGSATGSTRTAHPSRWRKRGWVSGRRSSR